MAVSTAMPPVLWCAVENQFRGHMRWRERRQGHWFGAAVLIAVGVIGLLANFDLLPRDILDQLWKLWPVIPLAIGIGILARRRQNEDILPPPDAKKN
jgi:hypothetical protein